MTAFSKIPVTIVTGFLGAGKTTLVRHLVENARGRRLALVINEFGDVGIDGEILKSCEGDACAPEAIVELANGCLCCTVADDFLPAIEGLLHRLLGEHLNVAPAAVAAKMAESGSLVDAIEAVRELLLTGGHASDDDLKAIDKEIKLIVNEAAEFSKESPEPALSELWTDIYA